MTTSGEPQRLEIPLDPIAALFKTRWEQECQTSILLADQVRTLRIHLNDMQWQLEKAQTEAVAASQDAPAQEAPAQEDN